MRCGNNRGETWHGAQVHSLRHLNQAELCAIWWDFGGGREQEEKRAAGLLGPARRVTEETAQIGRGRDAEEEGGWE